MGVEGGLVGARGAHSIRCCSAGRDVLAFDARGRGPARLTVVTVGTVELVVVGRDPVARPDAAVEATDPI